MSEDIGVGGVWKNSPAQWVGVGGVWKTVAAKWIGVGGVWKQFFGGLLISPLTASSSVGDSTSGTNASGRINFNTDGTITYAGAGTETGAADIPNWAATLAGVGTGVWIRFTPTTGTLTTNGAAAWAELTAQRSVIKGPVAGAGAANCIFTVEFSLDGGTSVALTSTGWIVGYSHAGL